MTNLNCRVCGQPFPLDELGSRVNVCPSCGEAAPEVMAPTLATGEGRLASVEVADAVTRADVGRSSRVDPQMAIAPSRGRQTVLPTGGSALPDYEILRELGRGGMGVVYEARQISLNRVVALKMVIAGAHAGTAQLVRFRTEARAVAQLRHPNIVQIYNIGEHEGLPYFTLEYVDGGSLEARLKGKAMKPRNAAELVAVLARAMHYAHGRGIVHRDLKPGNVLLTAAGVPKISDFGLAKHLEEKKQTRTGAVLGTPAYMAPEQARGEVAKVGPLADVYALGVILYELITGKLPFDGPAARVIVSVLGEEPPPPSAIRKSVPRDLETICLKCLHKDPERRYASAQHLEDDLRRYLRHEPIAARPTPGWERGLKWARRHPTLLSAAVLLVALVAGVAGAAFWRSAREARLERLREEQTHLLEERARQAEARALERDEELAAARRAARQADRPAAPPADAAKPIVQKPEEKQEPAAALVLTPGVGELTLRDGETRVLELAVDRRNCEGAVRIEVMNLPVGVRSDNLLLAADEQRAALTFAAGPDIDEAKTPLLLVATLGAARVETPLTLITKNPPRLAVQVDSVTLEPGKKRLLDVRIARHRCKGPVRLQWAGLPAAVVLKPEVIPADRNAGKFEIAAIGGAQRVLAEARATATLNDQTADARFTIKVDAPWTVDAIRDLLQKQRFDDSLDPDMTLHDFGRFIADRYDLPVLIHGKAFEDFGVFGVEDRRIGRVEVRGLTLDEMVQKVLAAQRFGPPMPPGKGKGPPPAQPMPPLAMLRVYRHGYLEFTVRPPRGTPRPPPAEFVPRLLIRPGG